MVFPWWKKSLPLVHLCYEVFPTSASAGCLKKKTPLIGCHDKPDDKRPFSTKKKSNFINRQEKKEKDITAVATMV